MAGADTVMLGSLLAGTEEAPGAVVDVDGARYKRSRGMATTTAAENRDDKDANVRADEGVEALTPYKGPVGDVVDEFCAGIQSGLSYCGGETIPAARRNAEFIRVAPSAKEREGYHADQDWEASASIAKRRRSPKHSSRRTTTRSRPPQKETTDRRSRPGALLVAAGVPLRERRQRAAAV